MPDFSVTIENDGLYIINNLQSKPTEDIEFILDNLTENKLEYKTIEL